MKKQINEIKRMQQLAGILKESQLNEISDNDQQIGILFHPEEDSDGMIDYIWNEDKVIDVIRSMGYEDAEEVAKEVMTLADPYDELEMFRNKTGDSDLDITDLTVGMFKQSVKDEFEL